LNQESSQVPELKWKIEDFVPGKKRVLWQEILTKFSLVSIHIEKVDSGKNGYGGKKCRKDGSFEFATECPARGTHQEDNIVQGTGQAGLENGRRTESSEKEIWAHGVNTPPTTATRSSSGGIHGRFPAPATRENEIRD